MESNDVERQIRVLRALSGERGSKKHKITPTFVLKYGKDIREVLNENEFLTQPEELLHLVKLRTGLS